MSLETMLPPRNTCGSRRLSLEPMAWFFSCREPTLSTLSPALALAVRPRPPELSWEPLEDLSGTSRPLPAVPSPESSLKPKVASASTPKPTVPSV
ncbi:hypothetical protein D9M68_731130 [compost metagenome]